ncbi:MAG: hypothetical protein ACR5LC_00550 [Symbiopectobacterium sp.]
MVVADTTALGLSHCADDIDATAGNQPPKIVSVLSLSFLCLALALLDARSMLMTMADIDGKTLSAEVKIVEMCISGHQNQQILVQVEKRQGRWIFPAFYATLTFPNAMEAWCGGQRWSIRARCAQRRLR